MNQASAWGLRLTGHTSAGKEVPFSGQGCGTGWKLPVPSLTHRLATGCDHSEPAQSHNHRSTWLKSEPGH